MVVLKHLLLQRATAAWTSKADKEKDVQWHAQNAIIALNAIGKKANY